MRVPAPAFADAGLLEAIRSDRLLEQLCNIGAGRWIMRRDADAGVEGTFNVLIHDV